jgi:hypothetical protein
MHISNVSRIHYQFISNVSRTHYHLLPFLAAVMHLFTAYYHAPALILLSQINALSIFYAPALILLSQMHFYLLKCTVHGVKNPFCFNLYLTWRCQHAFARCLNFVHTCYLSFTLEQINSSSPPHHCYHHHRRCHHLCDHPPSLHRHHDHLMLLTCQQPSLCNLLAKLTIKERLPALVRDLFTFSSKVIKSFIIV